MARWGGAADLIFSELDVLGVRPVLRDGAVVVTTRDRVFVSKARRG